MHSIIFKIGDNYFSITSWKSYTITFQKLRNKCQEKQIILKAAFPFHLLVLTLELIGMASRDVCSVASLVMWSRPKHSGTWEPHPDVFGFRISPNPYRTDVTLPVLQRVKQKPREVRHFVKGLSANQWWSQDSHQCWFSDGFKPRSGITEPRFFHYPVWIHQTWGYLKPFASLRGHSVYLTKGR